MRNNWRPNTTTTHIKPTMKIQAIDYIWETRKDIVEEELKTLLGVEELDQKDRRHFEQRNAAAKLAMDKMSVEEKAEMELGLGKRRAEGNLENIQRMYVCRLRLFLQSAEFDIPFAVVQRNIEAKSYKHFQKNAG